MPTASLAGGDAASRLERFDRLLCSPGSPYTSFEGALEGIRFARERGLPFLGTCGGCQHAVLEIARNLLGASNAGHAELELSVTDAWITPLACSLLDRDTEVTLTGDTSRVVAAYGRRVIVERFRCSFGLAPERERELERAGLAIVGRDDAGQPVVVELLDHRFFVGVLFQPQLSSSSHQPHPLIDAFLSARCD